MLTDTGSFGQHWELAAPPTAAPAAASVTGARLAPTPLYWHDDIIMIAMIAVFMTPLTTLSPRP